MWRQHRSPHVGQSAQLWKIVTVDGVEQSREVVNTSKYASTPKVIAVGNVGNDPNACAAINAAIATQDKATVRAAAAQYAGFGTTPDQAAEQPAADQAPAADAAAPAETTPAADAAAATDAAASDRRGSGTIRIKKQEGCLIFVRQPCVIIAKMI